VRSSPPRPRLRLSAALTTNAPALKLRAQLGADRAGFNTKPACVTPDFSTESCPFRETYP
jgi:hypothetical protein